jgi:hypothetical protein
MNFFSRITSEKLLSYVSYILYILLGIVGIILLFHIDYFSVPDTDFFAYVDQGKNFFSHPFSSGKYPIGYPLIVYALEHVLPIPNPGIRGSIFLNINAFIASCFLLFTLLRKKINFFSCIPVLLLLINPLTYSMILTSGNETMFILGILGVWFLRDRQYRYWAYILAYICLLFRHEAIVLIPALIAYDYMEGKKVFSAVVMYACVCLIIYVFAFASGGEYMKEIIGREAEIPNMTFLKNSFFLYPFMIRNILPIQIISSFVGFLCGAWIYMRKKNSSMMFGVLCIVFYSCIHIFFPDSSSRYSYIVLWFIYPVVLHMSISCIQFFTNNTLYRKILYLYICVLVCIVGYTLAQSLFIDYPYDRYYRLESKLAAEWFDAHVHSQATVFTHSPEIVKYYMKSPFVWLTSNKADFFNIIDTDKEHIIIVMDSYKMTQSFLFLDPLGVDFRQTFTPEFVEANFQLIDTVYKNDEHWAKFYSNKSLTEL